MRSSACAAASEIPTERSAIARRRRGPQRPSLQGAGPEGFGGSAGPAELFVEADWAAGGDPGGAAIPAPIWGLKWPRANSWPFASLGMSAHVLSHRGAVLVCMHMQKDAVSVLTAVQARGENLMFLWLPSQYGLLADFPQVQR